MGYTQPPRNAAEPPPPPPPPWGKRRVGGSPSVWRLGSDLLLGREPVDATAAALLRARGGLDGRGFSLVTGVGSIDSMILPQVHLRKPCYDFSFL